MEDKINIKIIKQTQDHIVQKKNIYIEFLYEHLGEFRDDKESISESIDYLLSPTGGGSIYEALNENDEELGLVIILNTHMKKFLPSNFLVYIAVNSNHRGKGIGGMLLDYVKKDLDGDICLHVEVDNPAANLYKRKGFTNKYLEMRYKA